MNGAQALFKALTDAGLDTCFANPGTSEMQLVYEIGLTKDVRPVLCLQENTVTGAADGYARMAGKPAFTLLHVGAGFANGIANLQNAGRANTSIVNIVGANATYHQPNYPEHELINGSIVDLAASSRIGRTKPKRPAIWPYSGRWRRATPGSVPGRFARWLPLPTATGTRRSLRRCLPDPWRLRKSPKRRFRKLLRS